MSEFVLILEVGTLASQVGRHLKKDNISLQFLSVVAGDTSGMQHWIFEEDRCSLKSTVELGMQADHRILL